MSLDRTLAVQLANRFTSACAFDRSGDLSLLVERAHREGASAETLAWALVNYAQNAAWNGYNEQDRAIDEVAMVLAGRMR